MRKTIATIVLILLATGLAFAGPPAVPVPVSNNAYDEATWNGSKKVPTQDAVRDVIQTIVAGGLSDLDDLPGDVTDNNLIDAVIIDAAIARDTEVPAAGTSIPYYRTGLTGSGAGDLDAISVAGLSEGDIAVVNTISGTTVVRYTYTFDADGVTPESSPTTIRPDDFGAAGVWRLTGATNQNLLSSANVAFSTATLTGANTLALGSSTANAGSILLKNATNTNIHTITAGAAGADFTWTTPTAQSGGANYLLNVDADGTMGYTDPASIGGGAGDVESAGDCASGACYDGSSDGGTYVRLYDGNSHYSALVAGDSTGNLTWTFPTAYPGASNAIVVSSDAGVLSTVASTTYQTAHAYLTDLAGITANQGDIMYFNGTDWVDLGPGVDGQYLKTRGAAANPEWGDPAGSGDITAVGDAVSGVAFTAGAGDGNTANTLYFEGATVNDNEIALVGANPGSDVTVTIPATTGTIVIGPAFGSDNILTKTDGTGTLMQATGITVDDSNNVTGAASLAASSHIALGADPADAGSIRLPNAGYIMAEADAAGTDVSVIGVTAAEVVAIGASGASGVTITPATTFSGGITNAGTIAAGTWQGTAVADTYVADDITLTNITQITNRSLDDITDGATYQKVLASDVDASGHVNIVQDSDATGAVQFTGLSATRAITLDDAAQTLAARNRDNTFTGANTVGDGDTDILTVRSIMRGGNSRAIWIDDDTTVAPTYATATNELFVEGDVEVGGTVYATSFTATGAGESYITLGNNAGGRSPGAGEYSLWFETDTSDQLKYAVNGAEKSVVNKEDAQTISGAKTLGAALTINRGATGAGQLIIAEDSDDGSNTATITAQAMTASYTLTLPTTDGDSGQYLQTNGSGSLSWAAPTATAAGSDTQVQFNDGGSALGGDAGFTYNKTTQALAVGKAGTDGSVVLYNELGGTDYNLTLATNSSQAADVTVTFPAATGTLATLGNAETISGAKTFSANVVLDDGSGASPSMTFTDATDETAVLSKADSGVLSLTTAAADGFNILVGNLWVGNGSPGQTINGEDAYIEGLAEIDGVLNADGGAVVTGNLDVAAAGVRLTGSNGSLTILGLGDGQDEDVKIDLNTTANTIEVTSPASSATAIDINSLNLVATGTISGATPSTTDADGQTLSAAQQYGYMHWATGAGTTNLAGAAAGMTVCVYSTTAAAVVINPDDADIIVLNGTALSAGDSITSASGAGDFICLMAKDAEYWYTLGRSGTWTDTN